MPTPLLLQDSFGDACPVGQTVEGNCVTLELPIINHDSTAMASIGSTALITRQSQVLRQFSRALARQGDVQFLAVGWASSHE